MPEITTERLVSVIESRIGPLQALYLFGSVAREQARPDSDVDLAVLVASPLTELARWELAQELAVAYGKDVDLIDLRSASTVMRSQILHSSHKLYQQADAEPVAAFEDFIVSDYARLNEERAGILADIEAPGVAFMADDVILNKAAAIDRCLDRVLQEYEGHQQQLRTDFTRQDAIVLNLLRACEAAIDLAMHITRVQSLGVPQSSRDAFDMLAGAGYIDTRQADRLKRMVGFRNIAIHNYREISLDIVEKIITERLDDFRDYTRALLSPSAHSPPKH